MKYIALAALLLAVAAGHDGTLPLYPHGAPALGMGDIPANALAQGVPYQQTTNDSVDAVDRWYRANLPRSCSRMSASGAVKYTCPGGVIVIQSHGGTIVSFIPPLHP
ncbi:MAG TPA: hypothetical protein VGG89_12280 [Candidatus Baltobacteraceae bacterium]